MRYFDKLTDEIIKNLKPKEKPYKKFDGKGLYLLVHPNGGKYWQLKYRFSNKQKNLSLGIYPEISLKEARDKCDEARKQIRDGLDPSYEKQILKAKKKSETYSSKEIKNTIEAIDKQIKIHEQAIEILNSSKQKINLIK
tara:strand:- start:614 stop:1030 length:417 start_codon:yes stop_codon:yes gene_type:complete